MPAEGLPTACILAGGLGSRLGELVKDTPKPLIEVAGRPFVLHQLQMLADQGIERVVMCVGHLGQRIVDSIGEERCGIEITYSFDAPGLSGTLGALRLAAPLLDQRFLILYGDTFLRVDVIAFFRGWSASGLLGAMTVLRNSNEWGPSNAVYKDGRVSAYDKRQPDASMKWIDYGLGGLDLEALNAVPAEQNDLSDLYRELASEGQLFGFEVNERFYDIGTPEALAETDAHLRAIGNTL
jgi:MurNAc alpha-1-phosphate uridylyltransferase